MLAIPKPSAQPSEPGAPLSRTSTHSFLAGLDPDDGGGGARVTGDVRQGLGDYAVCGILHSEAEPGDGGREVSRHGQGLSSGPVPEAARLAGQRA